MRNPFLSATSSSPKTSTNHVQFGVQSRSLSRHRGATSPPEVPNMTRAARSRWKNPPLSEPALGRHPPCWSVLDISSDAAKALFYPTHPATAKASVSLITKTARSKSDHPQTQCESASLRATQILRSCRAPSFSMLRWPLSKLRPISN
eukprot:4001037-Pyramimonas_sp.AAC.1